MRNLPQGVDSSCPRGVESQLTPKSGYWKKLFTLLDFRPENQTLVITIFTISMGQNCSISFSADPGGAPKKIRTFGSPRYNYDMQSIKSQKSVSQKPGGGVLPETNTLRDVAWPQPTCKYKSHSGIWPTWLDSNSYSTFHNKNPPPHAKVRVTNQIHPSGPL